MVLSLLLLNSFTLHTLFWVGLLCFLFSALRLAGIRPVMILRKSWQSLRARIKGLKSAWPGVGVRTKSQEIKAHQAVQQLRIIGPKLVIAVLFFALGWLWRDHQLDRTRRVYQQEYAAWKERSITYQKAFAAWAANQPKENK